MRTFTHIRTCLCAAAWLLCMVSFVPALQAQSDLCGAAPALNSNPTCVNVAGSLPAAATYTAIPLGCGAANDDVWYSFTAKSVNPTISISGSTVANIRLQLYSGTCAALTSLSCGTTTITAAGLTVGTTYLIRIYSTTNASGTFNICITDPAPANNLCGASVLLTSGTSCVNTAGNMYASTLTTPTTIAAPDCSGGLATYDVWYRFVAQTTNPTITLSSVGASLAPVVRMQLLSNNCGGTFTSFFCGTTSIAANFLTPGTTYFIRIYATGALPTTPTGFGFNICITDPVATAPSNDECTGAINLPVFNTCSNNPGNMAGSTPSPVPLGGTCTGPLAYDVWYRFTAAGPTATVTLGGIGANFVNPRIEVLSGTCSGLSSVACGTSPLAAAGLTAGTVYYIRVYSNTAPPPNGNARFTICVTSTSVPPVRFGNSYVNITKQSAGGVVQTGDILEIRMTINHITGTMSRLRFVDNLPSHTTMAASAPHNTIRIITNEGLTYKSYTQAAGDDPATYLAAPPPGQFQVRANLGFGGTNPGIPVNNTATESASATGTMNAAADRPRGGGGLLFAVAYRVVVTGVTGDTINLNAPQFIYYNGSADVTLTGIPFRIVISDNLSLCTNSIGINYASEFGGTFGTGTTLTRSTDLTIPISGYTFINDVNAYNGVGDGRYSIVKNISPRSGTQTQARRRPNCAVPTPLASADPYSCDNRMFGGFWYIDGDHTGTNNAAGNPPPDAATPGGYMLMVNADYVASEVYRQTITNLCPNTYYEFSAWVRNICPTCGIDSTGAQFTGSATAPANGYPGVYPNLSFALNDVDYYSTGEVDTVGWVKKGFLFLTGPTQTSATFSIRNNSQGGGGNDWVLDDVSVATCLPNMTYSPTVTPNVCEGDMIIIRDTVRSFFNTYTEYKWQRSTDGGATWTDIPGTTATASPFWNGSAYEFVTSYSIPPAWTTPANDGDMYRVVVASTVANLASSTCNFSDPVSITLNVLTDCNPVLGIRFLSVSGEYRPEQSLIRWVTSRENESVVYEVERSDDGIHFSPVATVAGQGSGAEQNTYSWPDPRPISGTAWYRIALRTPGAPLRYSSIIQLQATRIQEFRFGLVPNPVAGEFSLEVLSATAGMARAELMDLNGRVLHRQSVWLNSGTNMIYPGSLAHRPAGIYMVRLVKGNSQIVTKVLKSGHP